MAVKSHRLAVKKEVTIKQNLSRLYILQMIRSFDYLCQTYILTFRDSSQNCQSNYLEWKPFWLISNESILTNFNATKRLVLAKSVTVKHLNTKRAFMIRNYV